MPIPANTFVSQGKARISEIQNVIANMGSSFQKHDQGGNELQIAYDQTLDELVKVNLPALNQEAFHNVRQYTGYGQFEAKNPFMIMNEEHARLTQTINNIDNDERYLRREELINPVSGELVINADTIRQNYTMLKDAVMRYESEPRFLQLIQRSYGTPDYVGRIWQLDYYRDWRAGSAIEKKFGKTFYDIRSSYLPIKQLHDDTYQELTVAEKQINDVKYLIDLREKSSYRLNNLPQVVLEESQTALRQHLQYVDREQLFQWAQGDRVREALIKKLHGLEKKLEYLKEMVVHQQQAEKEVLQEYVYKLNRKVVKYQRPKYHYGFVPDRDAQILNFDPRQKLFEKRNKFWKSYDTVYEFDDYDYYDYRRDMLWWDLMTAGRYNGRYINEVNYYYTNHPGYSYSHEYYYQKPTLQQSSYYDSNDDYDYSSVEIS